MNLCVDQGNSSTKVAVFEQDVLQEMFHFDCFTELELLDLLERFPIKKCIVSSVVNTSDADFEFVKKKVDCFLFLDHKTQLPIQNNYKTPETLGRDRLAVVVGANYLQPASNILVIDAGTAITYDFVNDQNQYEGGNIAPGLNMRCKALNYFTQKLPLVSSFSENDNTLWGTDTESAIQKGVAEGMLFEIEGYISELNKKNTKCSVFLTGGDANYFFSCLKSSTFVEKNLVLIGLNRILEYNAKK